MATMVSLLLSLLGCSMVFQSIAVAASVPTNITLSQRSVPSWKFYHGNTASQHQTNFDQLSSSGYRMISLSAYGQPPNHAYAAVWVLRPTPAAGPVYEAIHEATGEQYQSWFDKFSGEGYVSTIITATGPEGGARFAGVMEKNGVGDWYQKCGLTHDQYTNALGDGLGKGYVLKSFTEYGAPTSTSPSDKDRRYCGIWYHNTETNSYSAYTDQTYSEYQTTYTSETTTKSGWHPSYFAIAEDHLISAQFTNTNVGSWVAVIGMSSVMLEVEFLAQAALGRYIIHLQGGGTGGNVNFAAIWAQPDV